MTGAARGDDGRDADGRRLDAPDLAPCEACLAELADPRDRRHRYPFVSCLDCGPRFTVAVRSPGTAGPRQATSLVRFPLCADCRRDDADPAGRRCGDPALSCPACGPRLELVEADDDGPALRGEAALARAREVLADGGIVAVKGPGGYHLACDALDGAAVARLRARQQCGDEPLPVLVPDLVAARALARVDDLEAGLLTGRRRPVVLLHPHPDPAPTGLAAEVAPRAPRLGVLLPPSPLHVLLLGLPGDPPGPAALVLAPGSVAGGPMGADDDDAVRRLSGVADAWLRHDRAIQVPCDDSVVEVVDGEPLPVRRSRGEAPLPVPLPLDVGPTIAAGGDHDNVFSVAAGRAAWLSAHVGDLGDVATQRAFARAVDHLQAVVDVEPQRLVVDRHPLYRSARGAEEAAEHGMVVERVQHHHAHVASVLAEHGYAGAGPVLGIALDGAGHGDDGAVWGGEVLLAGYAGAERLAHLSYVPLAGGDAAVRRPYRMALAHLHAAGLAWDDDLPPVAVTSAQERSVLGHQLLTGLACVPTSSAGRLVDAVASLAGVRHEVGYEGQAALELQALAEQAVDEPGAYPLPLLAPAAGPLQWDCGALVRAVVADVRAGVPAGVVGVRFHRGVAAAVVRVALHAQGAHGVTAVALTGGVFTDALLLSLTSRGLREAGFEVLRHRRVPPGDGGLALGQVVVGAARRGDAAGLVDLAETSATRS